MLSSKPKDRKQAAEHLSKLQIRFGAIVDDANKNGQDLTSPRELRDFATKLENVARYAENGQWDDAQNITEEVYGAVDRLYQNNYGAENIDDSLTENYDVKRVNISISNSAYSLRDLKGVAKLMRDITKYANRHLQ